MLRGRQRSTTAGHEASPRPYVKAVHSILHSSAAPARRGLATGTYLAAALIWASSLAMSWTCHVSVTLPSAMRSMLMYVEPSEKARLSGTFHGLHCRLFGRS